MTNCTFAGHREDCPSYVALKLQDVLELLIKQDHEFVFFVGGMGAFDALCARTVRLIRRKHPEKQIDLILVSPYMTQSINTNKGLLQEVYDDILIPMELAGYHYKSAIQKRNRWMVDHAQYLISYTPHHFGGAYRTVNYAKRRASLFFSWKILSLTL